jgi:hypothetical protein
MSVMPLALGLELLVAGWARVNTPDLGSVSDEAFEFCAQAFGVVGGGAGAEGAADVLGA